MPRALRTVVLVTVLWAVMASTAAANVVRVPIATPAAGKVDITTFDLAAGAKAPRRVKLTAVLPAVQKRKLKVLIATQKTKTALHVIVAVVRPGAAAATATAARGGVYVNADGGVVKITRSRLRHARDVLRTLDPTTDLCTDAAARARLVAAIGLDKPAGQALLDTILRVACGKGDDTDRRALAALHLDVPQPPATTTPPTETPPTTTPPTTTPPTTPPAPTYTFSCRAFSGNPNEGICTLRTDQQAGAFNQVRLTASGGNTISQCYEGPTNPPCTVENPGQPNNSALFTFPSPLTDSGDLNLRSPSTPWPFPLGSAFSTNGGGTFTNGPSYP
jgi:hypothetical protein